MVKIPENINDLRDYSELHKLLKVCKNFINNSNKYIEEVIFTEYVKTYKEWSKLLSKKDLKQVDKLIKTHKSYGNWNFEKENLNIYRSINTNTFGFFNLKITPGFTGALTHNGIKFNFNKTGTIIKIEVNYATKRYRRENISWTHHKDIWSLNLIEKSFKYVETEF